jgi:hypothetical protein
MEWLINLPSLVKLAVIFALMLAIVRLKVNVGWALCLGAVICGFWFGQTPPELLKSAWLALTDAKYVILVAIIMLVLVLNHSLQQSGQIDRIVDSFFRLSRRPRTTLVFFPALLGLLPMPGGAQFSAPMVETAGTPLGLTGEQKTLINYWFRHVWEYCWVLYPGVFLSAQLTGYPIWVISLFQLPLTLAVLGFGYFFYLRRLDLRHRRIEGNDAPAPPGHPAWHFLAASAPVWLVIVLFAVLKLAYLVGGALGLVSAKFQESLFARNNLDNALLVAAVCLSTLYTWVARRMSPRAVWRVFWQKDMYSNLVIGLGIIVFAGVLAGSGAAKSVAEDFKRYDIPLWLVAVILPFTVGAVTGITMNMVALTYPIIFAALQMRGQEHLVIPYCCLAFASGYGAILITPLHICMIQSNHFFGLGPTAVLRKLAVPVALTIATGGLLFLAYGFIFPHVGWGPGSHVIPIIPAAR